MLRWMLLLGTAMIAAGSADAADLPQSGGGFYGKAPVFGGPVPVYGGPVYVEEESDLLFTPSDSGLPEIHFPPHTPILLGSATLPGLYGTTHSYEYLGPYYGGPNLNYRYRLPYTCGVLGYC